MPCLHLVCWEQHQLLASALGLVGTSTRRQGPPLPLLQGVALSLPGCPGTAQLQVHALLAWQKRRNLRLLVNLWPWHLRPPDGSLPLFVHTAACNLLLSGPAARTEGGRRHLPALCLSRSSAAGAPQLFYRGGPCCAVLVWSSGNDAWHCCLGASHTPLASASAMRPAQPQGAWWSPEVHMTLWSSSGFAQSSRNAHLTIIALPA